MASQPTFKHPWLDPKSQQFRTVKLEPPQADRIVRCEMLVNDLNEPDTTYAALSYMWGTDEPIHEILIDEKPIAVRSNLLQFLVRAQHWRLDPIFIDALCINQDDINERNQQVKLMGEIYSNARRVISWLGHDNERVEAAIPFIQQFFPLSNGLLRDYYKGKEDSMREAQQPWNSVHMFTSLRYWTRVWMVQEILKAKAITFVYGNHSIDGEDLSEFSQALGETNPCPAPLPNLLLQSRCFDYLDRGFRKPYSKSGSEMHAKLIDVLWEYGLSACGEKRDRVYALLSLAKEGPQFPVDYGITLTELFFQIWQLQPQTGIHLLAFAKHMILALLDSPNDIDEPRDSTRPKRYSFRLHPVRFSPAAKDSNSSPTISKHTFTFGNGDYTIEYLLSRNLPTQGSRTGARSSLLSIHPQQTIRVNINISQIKNQAFKANDVILNIENSGLLVVGRRNSRNELQIVAKLSLFAGLSHSNGTAEIGAIWNPWSSQLERMKDKYQAYSVETMEDGSSFLCFNEIALRSFMSGLHYRKTAIQIYGNSSHGEDRDYDDDGVKQQGWGSNSVYEVDLLSVHWYMPTGEHSINEIAVLQDVYDHNFRGSRAGLLLMSISEALHALPRLRIDLVESDANKGEDKPLPWRELLESESDTGKDGNITSWKIVWNNLCACYRQ